jgi:hypothetical protein
MQDLQQLLKISLVSLKSLVINMVDITANNIKINY